MWTLFVVREFQLSYDVISGGFLGDQFYYHSPIYLTATFTTRQIVVTRFLYIKKIVKGR